MKCLSNVIAVLGVASCIALPLVVSAQPETKPATGDAAPEDRRSPLPNNFGKIAVSDEQRVKLYGIQDEYEAKIDVLQEQIRALIRERDAKMEIELTAGQKLRLKELREEARQKAAQEKAAAPTATPAAPAAGKP